MAHAGLSGAKATHSAVPQFGAQASPENGAGAQAGTPSFRSGLQALMQSMAQSSGTEQSTETPASLTSLEMGKAGIPQDGTKETPVPASGTQAWKPFLQIKTAASQQPAQAAAQKNLPAAKQLTASDNPQATLAQDESATAGAAGSHAHSTSRSSVKSAEPEQAKRPGNALPDASATATVIPLSIAHAPLPQPAAASQSKASPAANTESHSALSGAQAAIAGAAAQQAGAESTAQSTGLNANTGAKASLDQESDEEFAASFTHSAQEAHTASAQTANTARSAAGAVLKPQFATEGHALTDSSANGIGNKAESDSKSTANAVPGAGNPAQALKHTVPQEAAAQAQAVEAVTPQAHPSLMHNPGTVAGVPGTAAANAGSAAGATAPQTAHDTFTALDAGSSQPSTTLVHASARQVEAGYQDPTLGWVSVRADQTPAGVHAAILPGTADATQALSTHMASLNSYLTQHHPGVTATITAPQGQNQSSGVVTGFTGQESGQGSGQQGTPGGSPQQQHTGSEAAGVQSVAAAFTPRNTSSVEPAATTRAHNGRISVMA